ncbi:hypothetical protein K438DRAFT_2025890 [Mycena galopus ATCC 62051]|nr:hypothetical protein K438DRAFT_2025890 [Mycena galopus ATCC 62051]
MLVADANNPRSALCLQTSAALPKFVFDMAARVVFLLDQRYWLELKSQDAEVLEQLRLLFLSLRSVKLEWPDLDGMRIQSSCPAFPHPPACSPTHSLLNLSRPPGRRRPAALEAFAVLTNTRLVLSTSSATRSVPLLLRAKLLRDPDAVRLRGTVQREEPVRVPAFVFVCGGAPPRWCARYPRRTCLRARRLRRPHAAPVFIQLDIALTPGMHATHPRPAARPALVFAAPNGTTDGDNKDAPGVEDTALALHKLHDPPSLLLDCDAPPGVHEDVDGSAHAGAAFKPRWPRFHPCLGVGAGGRRQD